jgi:hypothetical protein
MSCSNGPKQSEFDTREANHGSCNHSLPTPMATNAGETVLDLDADRSSPRGGTDGTITTMTDFGLELDNVMSIHYPLSRATVSIFLCLRPAPRDFPVLASLHVMRLSFPGHYTCVLEYMIICNHVITHGIPTPHPLPWNMPHLIHLHGQVLSTYERVWRCPSELQAFNPGKFPHAQGTLEIWSAAVSLLTSTLRRYDNIISHCDVIICPSWC